MGFPLSLIHIYTDKESKSAALWQIIPISLRSIFFSFFNLVTGLPKTIVVTSDETLEALREPALQIVDAVHNVLAVSYTHIDVYKRQESTVKGEGGL